MVITRLFVHSFFFLGKYKSRKMLFIARNFIQKLSYLRILFVILIITEFVIMHHYKRELFITSSCLNMTVIFLLSLAVIPSRLLFVILFTITNFVLILNLHCLRIYNQIFSDLGVQFLSAFFDTNFDEVKSYTKFISTGDLASVIALFLSCILCFVVTRNYKESRLKSVKYALAFIIFVTALKFSYVNGFIEQYLSYRALDSNNKVLISKKNNFKWGGEISENSPKNVIIFIGESMRYENFIKYYNEKDTVVFSDAISQYAYTLGAMPQILSRKKIEDKTGLFYESSIFKLFEEAGYDTNYISYLKANNGGDDAINFIVTESNHYYLYGPHAHNISRIVSSAGMSSDFVNDMDIVPIIKQIINSSSKNKLIVIKMIGNHYNFEDRYPVEYDINQPSLMSKPGDYVLKNKERIINTYNNSILYSIHVINSVLNILRETNQSSLLVYSSDHGLNIFDNDVWLTAQVKESYHVPLLWYANQSYLENESNLTLWNSLKRHKDDPVTTSYIFETISSLSSIKRDKFDSSKDLTTIAHKISGKREVVGNRKDTIYYEDY